MWGKRRALYSFDDGRNVWKYVSVCVEWVVSRLCERVSESRVCESRRVLSV